MPLERIALHRDSPAEHWRMLHNDLKNPLLLNPEGNRGIIAFDYETHQETNAFFTQTNEQRQKEYARKTKLHSKGYVKTVPTFNPIKFSDAPFDPFGVAVTGVALCANFDRAYYINFTHSDRDGCYPVAQKNEQGRFLRDLFAQCTRPIELVAHYAHHEYCVSMAQGWDFLWADATRYFGGFVCTYQLAKLFPYQKRSLKALSDALFDSNQMEYLEAIFYNHAMAPVVDLLTKFCNGRAPDVKKVKLMLKIASKESSRRVNKNHLWAILRATMGDCTINETFVTRLRKQITAAIQSTEKQFHSMAANTVTEVAPYACDDAFWTLKLFHRLAGDAFKRVYNSTYLKSLWAYYRHVDHPLLRLVAEMKLKGVLPNTSYISQLQEDCIYLEAKQIGALKRRAVEDLKGLYPALFSNTWDTPEKAEKLRKYVARRQPSIVGGLPSSGLCIIPDISKNIRELVEWISKLDVTNPGNLKALFFKILCLPHFEMKKKGPSLDRTSLVRLSLLSKVAEETENLRTTRQTYSLYALAFDRFVHPKTGRIHATFNQSGASTGRFTAGRPNLQQLKKRATSELDKKLPVRNLILSDPGRVLLAVDLSQIELRVMAWLSRDPEMSKCYLGDADGNYVDIHTRTCNYLFSSVLTEENKGYLRRASKPVNFLCQFGGGPSKLLLDFRKNGIEEYSLDDAARFIRGWFTLYSGVDVFNQTHARLAKQRELSSTQFGRPRYFPGFASTFDRAQDGMFARQANNHAIQGTAGDILKIIMARIYWSQYLKDLGVEIVLTVHDELVMSVPNESVLKAFPVIVAAFCQFEFPIPIRASAGLGEAFGALVELEMEKDESINWSSVTRWVQSVLPQTPPFNPKNIPSEHLQFIEDWLHAQLPNNKNRSEED